MNLARTLATVVVTGMSFGAASLITAKQNPQGVDLTDQPAEIDPIVEFGHPGILTGAENHVMIKDEVTILKGGQVTFRVNGLGHGIAIYPVSKNTTPEHIAQHLCDGVTPDCSPLQARTIRDGKDRVVIEVEPGDQSIRVDYAPGQVLSAGSGAFLNGTTATLRTLVRVRFAEDGRYLIVCMNRAHLVNQWMFGFVNVTTPR